MAEQTTAEYAAEHGLSRATVRRRIRSGELTARRVGRSWRILDVAPGGVEWMRLMSASKVAAVLGVSPYTSPYALWHEMKGLAPREATNAVQRRGHLLEAAVLDWWREQHGIIPGDDARAGRQITAWLDDWGIATIDEVAHTLQGLVGVEAKTTGSWDEWGAEGSDEIPAHYYAQTLWQLACDPTLERIYIPVLGPRLDFREYVVERDNHLIDSIVARCRTFWESLADDVPPPLDDHVATLAVLKRMHPGIDDGAEAVVPDDVATRYVVADIAAKAAEAALVGAKAALLEQAGNANFIVTAAGDRIARRQPNRSGVSLVRVAKTIPAPALEAVA